MATRVLCQPGSHIRCCIQVEQARRGRFFSRYGKQPAEPPMLQIPEDRERGGRHRKLRDPLQRRPRPPLQRRWREIPSGRGVVPSAKPFVDSRQQSSPAPREPAQGPGLGGRCHSTSELLWEVRAWCCEGGRWIDIAAAGCGSCRVPNPSVAEFTRREQSRGGPCSQKKTGSNRYAKVSGPAKSTQPEFFNLQRWLSFNPEQPSQSLRNRPHRSEAAPEGRYPWTRRFARRSR